MEFVNPWVQGEDNLPDPLSGSFENSFAYCTIRDRLPVILTTIIDHLCREKNSIVDKFGEEALEELKDVVGKFSKLRNEVTTDKKILPILDDYHDAKVWNQCIEHFQQSCKYAKNSWFTLPILFVECYMYRRVLEAFLLTSHLHDYDPFRQAKENSFNISMGPASILASYFLKNLASKENFQSKICETLFLISLWSNKCDLSISAGEENAQKDDPLQQLTLLTENVIASSWPDIEVYLKKLKGDVPGTIDFILDNMGFELFADLVLADYLLRNGYCQTVNFHVKDIPWFVSDTMAADFHWVLSVMKESSNEAINQLAQTWQDYLDRKDWVVHSDPFWTYYHPFSYMERVAPKLYKKLSQSSLLIFKGDLNYRKLLGDYKWSFIVDIKEALMGFHPAPMVVLRTAKSELVVGLRPGQSEKLCTVDANWLCNGNYAVIQFSL